MINLIKKVLVSIVSIYPIKRIVSLDIYSFISNPVVKTKNSNIKFFGFGKMSLWRAKTFFTKEPETIEWIDSFEEGDIFWDIGANIGVYSLYAASLNKNLKIFSFEPSAANYFVLNRNIFLNKFDSVISAYPIAFNNESVLGFFQMTSDEPGGALNVFNKEKVDESSCGDATIKINISQAMLSFSIDSFIDFYKQEVPNHIKIDVDNIEDKIVEGSITTLKNYKVKSLLIELNEHDISYTSKVINTLSNAGFRLKTKKHSTMFDSGKFSSLYNYIFVR